MAIKEMTISKEGTESLTVFSLSEILLVPTVKDYDTHTTHKLLNKKLAKGK